MFCSPCSGIPAGVTSFLTRSATPTTIPHANRFLVLLKSRAIISETSTIKHHQLPLLFNNGINTDPNRQRNPTQLLVLQPTPTVLGFPVGIFIYYQSQYHRLLHYCYNSSNSTTQSPKHHIVDISSTARPN